MSFCEDIVVPLCNMKFPEKMWLIVNECNTGAIGWGPDGDTIALDYEKFQEEYLVEDVGVFKTSNMASFVRQLNLYGFRKCNRYNEDKHEFRHPLFVKGRKDLIQFVKRKPGSSISLSSARMPKRSKVRTNAEFSTCQKENAVHDKYIKSERSIHQKAVSPSTPKRTPLSSRQNSSFLNSMRCPWWNNISPPPYIYSDRSIVQQGWFPMNSPYYNSQTFIKHEPEESQDQESSVLENAMGSENQFASKNNSNLFYWVVPGYPSSQSHNIFSNPGYYGGMFSFPGMHMGFSPKKSKNTDSYMGEVPVRFEAGN